MEDQATEKTVETPVSEQAEVTPPEVSPVEESSPVSNLFTPQEVDPKLDVSEMPVGAHILAAGSEYILNEEKMLVKQ